jgi:hypothetical protein
MYYVTRRSGAGTQALSLRDPGNQTDTGLLATLFDPVLTNLGNGVLQFKGIERVASDYGPAGYAQEWRCELA